MIEGLVTDVPVAGEAGGQILPQGYHVAEVGMSSIRALTGSCPARFPDGPTIVPYRIPPTQADIEIANAVSSYTNPPTEEVASVLTLGADERVILAIAAGWWLYCRRGSQRQRRNSDHILATTLVVSVVPHLLKSIFDQQRPDRLTIRGHLHGVPVSGKANDAFPSGHAMHVGALASAASVLPPAERNVVWAFGAGLALTRILLLAHWVSDVVAGLALGALTERLLRFCTSFGAAEHERTPPAN